MSADVSDSVLLALANVESAYGPIKAIRGVSLQVKRGQIATVLGSNGAGKSSILKTISGIIDPRRGSMMPEMVLRMVLLPAPLDPSTVAIRPRLTCRLTPRMALMGP